jgi:hypothetical protein
MIWLVFLLIWFIVMIIFKVWYTRCSEKKRQEILDSRLTDKGTNLNAKLTQEESRKRR